MLLLGNRGKLRGGQQWKSDSSNDSDGDKDSEFWELRDLCVTGVQGQLCLIPSSHTI